ncbi:hypothetical protein ACP275_02G178200 [Erythranthe tilingii]
MATSKGDESRNKPQPQLIKLDRNSKLAEQVLNKMSNPKSTANDKPTVQLEARSPWLGLGATLPTESKFTHSDNPVERKLFSMLNECKRKARLVEEDLATSANKDEKDDEKSSDDDDEMESRTRTFSKSKPRIFNPLLHATKTKH